jgi:hypothetical protein
VRPGGTLVVMTSLSDGHDLDKWWYLNDVTHVAVWADATLRWFARSFGFALRRSNGTNLHVFQKEEDQTDESCG